MSTQDTPAVTVIEARFSQYSRDLFWSAFIDGSTCRWSGYDDFYWWNSVAPSEQFRIKEHNGNRYILDPNSNIVTQLT